MAVFGLGSQTAASLTRPAAQVYPAVSKPWSIDLLRGDGLAASLDSDWLARGIDDLILQERPFCGTVLPGDVQGHSSPQKVK